MISLAKYKKKFSDFRSHLIKTFIIYLLNRDRGNVWTVSDNEKSIIFTENSLDIDVQSSLFYEPEKISKMSYSRIHEILDYLSIANEKPWIDLKNELDLLIQSLLRDYFLIIKNKKRPKQFITSTLSVFSYINESNQAKMKLKSINFIDHIIYFDAFDIKVGINDIDTILENA